MVPVVQAHRHATSCTVLCTVSEEAHAALPSTMLGESAYAEYLAALKEVSIGLLASIHSCDCHIACLHNKPGLQARGVKRRTKIEHSNAMASAGCGRSQQEGGG